MGPLPGISVTTHCILTSATGSWSECVRLEVFLMFWAPCRSHFLFSMVLLGASFQPVLLAQADTQDDKQANSAKAAGKAGQEQDPLKRPLRKKQQKAARDGWCPSRFRSRTATSHL